MNIGLFFSAFFSQNDQIQNRFTVQLPNNWSYIWEACLLFYISKPVMLWTMSFLLFLLPHSQSARWEAGLPFPSPSPSARLKQMAEGHEIKSKHRWVTNFPKGDKKKKKKPPNPQLQHSKQQGMHNYFVNIILPYKQMQQLPRYDDNKQGRYPPGRLHKQQQTMLQSNGCKEGTWQTPGGEHYRLTPPR